VRNIRLLAALGKINSFQRAAHAALALSNSQLSVVVIGCTGQVGRALMSQLRESGRVLGTSKPGVKIEGLSDLRLDLRVTCLARQSGMIFNYDGIDINTMDELFGADSEQLEACDLFEISRLMNEDFNGNQVVIDCSDSQLVADMYPRFMASGINVITANKKAGAGPAELYESCKKSQKLAQWYYETTGPGSGLPVLSTIKDMMQSGDSVRCVEGIFSGTLSSLVNSVAAGTPLSEALRKAHRDGLCEPDPRDDLTGLDVRRKVVVLARELGFQMEMSDVECEPLLPEELQAWEPQTGDDAPPLIEQLVEALKPYDQRFADKVAAAGADNKVLTPLAVVDVESKSASFRLTPLEKTNRLTLATENDNIISITSSRYSPQPLIVQGPGAGADITASGLFADLLHLSRTLVEWTIPQIE